MQLYTKSRIAITDQAISVNGQKLLESGGSALIAEEVYRELAMSYPKFFKMDLLCKWAIIGAECLLRNGERYLYDGLEKEAIAVVLITRNGCLDVDKKYLESTKDIASPALFVYTLPNIMLGEICIRHGFKGEQLCMMQEDMDRTELHFWVNDLLKNRGMRACLCGFVDATEDGVTVEMEWVIK